MDDLVHVCAEMGVLVGEAARQKFLIDTARRQLLRIVQVQSRSHLLRSLITVERQATASAFHDYARAQTAQHARLVILGRIELRDDGIIRIRQVRLTCWADTSAIRVREP